MNGGMTAGRTGSVTVSRQRVRVDNSEGVERSSTYMCHDPRLMYITRNGGKGMSGSRLGMRKHGMARSTRKRLPC